MTFLDDCANLHPITIALVNNMPDGAFVDTEQQFRTLACGAGTERIEFALYTIKEIPRSEKAAAVIASRYRGLDELWTRPPDALIVTGTEPKHPQLHLEPYWPYLARLLEWAAENVRTTLLSCLASHASILLFDGIERGPRPTKCSGVFDGVVEEYLDPLATGLPQVVPMPHSRLNDVPEVALVDAGYRIIVGSGASHAGWSVATREQGDSLFVLCQGHPEYGTLSLLREYRRDVRRALYGRGAIPYPRLPEGYLAPEAVKKLTEFAARAKRRWKDPDRLWARFPYDEVAPGVENTWAAPSALLYANWVQLARPAVLDRV
ncbi:MAG: homoserine O-succinyltransferase [Solirubrobacterales bacterium]|nr:homoserine O-succinyltransferase [Solirubrobacterales bacterium]